MVLRQALRDAHNLGMVQQNVMERTRTPKRSKSEPVRALTVDELHLIMNAMPDRLRRLTLFLAYSGLRRGEVCGLSWDDVDMRAGTIQVRRQVVPIHGNPVVEDVKTKAGRRQFVLAPQAVDLLKTQKMVQEEDRLAAGSTYDNPEGLRPAMCCISSVRS